MINRQKAGGWDGPRKALILLPLLLILPVYSAGAGPSVLMPPKPSAKPLVERVSYATSDADQRPAAAVPLPPKRPLLSGGQGMRPDNALLYKQIFAAQERGDWGKADQLMEMLTDYRLRGYVLFQRYMHPRAYRASFEELRGWLDLYADYPGADRVYKLALARMPQDYRGAVNRPRPGKGGVSGYVDLVQDRAKNYKSPKRRSAAQRKAVIALSQTIRSDLSRGAPTRAYKRLQDDQRAVYLDHVEYDSLRARIAHSYMLEGKPDQAAQLAGDSAVRSGVKVPEAGWVAGLVAWRQGDYSRAETLFAQVADSEYTDSWMRAAGAYWASRAAMHSGDARAVTPWLERAALYPRTFYGLLATRALGQDFDFDWGLPPARFDEVGGLKDMPAMQRAMALVAAGQYHWAEDELRHVDVRQSGIEEAALLSYAQKAGMPAFAMRLAEAIPTPSGGLYDAALYPLVPWIPAGGYKVDKALLHALIRQESRFDPEAQNSASGATGLMQLMPQTASHVSSRYDFRSAADRHILKNPQINLDIGQRYIQELMAQDAVDGELLSLLIAYNAGPGNLRKWKRELVAMQDDPLLFIESIPVAETRKFVERVMANYWIYRLRLDQPTPSLDEVAGGGWARYVALDERRYAAR